MFDLDREIDSWCRQVLGARCVNTAGMDELVDHVYCEVERARSEGMDDAAAFAAATSRLGEPEELAREYRKNYGPVARLFQKLLRLEYQPEYRLHYRLFIGHSVIWALAIIAAALIANSQDLQQATSFTITLFLIAGYFVSERLLRKALRKRH